MTVDYDRIAPTYRARYAQNDYAGVETAMRSIVEDRRAILEVGCGTGHWLTRFEGPDCRVFGVDASAGMLRRADPSLIGRSLTRGVAGDLPFTAGAFDCAFVINALHHFPSKRASIEEAARVLRPGGRFATVGLDPSTGIDQWYIYDYFPRALEADLQRYPSTDRIRSMMADAGFTEISTSVAQHIPASEPAQEYLESPAFHRHATSQLSLLTDDEFEDGVERIWNDVREGERTGTAASLTADLRLYITVGVLPE